MRARESWWLAQDSPIARTRPGMSGGVYVESPPHVRCGVLGRVPWLTRILDGCESSPTTKCCGTYHVEVSMSLRAGRRRSGRRSGKTYSDHALPSLPSARFAIGVGLWYGLG